MVFIFIYLETQREQQKKIEQYFPKLLASVFFPVVYTYDHITCINSLNDFPMERDYIYYFLSFFIYFSRFFVHFWFKFLPNVLLLKMYQKNECISHIEGHVVCSYISKHI